MLKAHFDYRMKKGIKVRFLWRGIFFFRRTFRSRPVDCIRKKNKKKHVYPLKILFIAIGTTCVSIRAYACVLMNAHLYSCECFKFVGIESGDAI